MDMELVAQEKIDLIKSWAEEHPDFDTTFVDSIQEKLHKNHYLTPGQFTALDNIIERWRMDDV